jgi:HK97 family phage prohead protease
MRFAGYAAVFDRPDRGGDIVRKGAFSRALKPGHSPSLPLLLQHDTGQRIGEIEHLSEDAYGLRVIARMEDTAPVRAGSGLSFGYRVRGMNYGTYRELKDLDLIEVSVVTHPMQPLARVLAIWADGKLLRGEAGDFKTPVQFRFYTGDEGQSVDPLIASAEGAGSCPAYRGLAYAVFGDMALASYGNRIPSISFEVIADETDMSIGTIVEALLPRVHGQLCPTTVGGFVAKGDSARAVIQSLATVVPLHIRPGAGPITFAEVGDVAESPKVIDLGASHDGRTTARFESARPSTASIPSVLTLAYSAPDRDYQPSLERVRREAPARREANIALPLTLSSANARQLAERALAARWAGRGTARTTLSWRYLWLAPGMIVTIPGLSGRWHIEATALTGMVVTLDLIRPSEAVGIFAGSDSGRGVQEADMQHGPTTLAVLDLPSIDASLASAPIVVVAAAGVSAGWRRASLLQSIDDGSSWQEAGSTAPPAIMGRVSAALGDGSSAVMDRINVVDVDLLHPGMTLQSADDAALLAGANVAAIGAELIQFQSAALVSPARYRLTALLRGRRGTDWAMRAHQSNEAFVLLDRVSLAPIDVAAGTPSLRIMAAGVGDLSLPVEQSLLNPGAALLPLAPVHLRAARFSDTIVVSWVRRSRVGWGWTDGVDVPLGEEVERYRIIITPNAGPPRTFEVAAPQWIYAAAERSADLSEGAQSIQAAVTQLGNHGASRPAHVTFSIL